MVLQHAILVERKETIDITVKSNKFYLQENSDKYGGHDLIYFLFSTFILQKIMYR